jgi:hypothetical protein
MPLSACTMFNTTVSFRFVNLKGPVLVNIHELDFSHNSIENISPKLFSSTHFSSIEILDLSFNKIELSSSLVLSDFLKNVLRENQTLSQLFLVGNVHYKELTTTLETGEEDDPLRTKIFRECLPNLDYIDGSKVQYHSGKQFRNFTVSERSSSPLGLSEEDCPNTIHRVPLTSKPKLSAEEADHLLKVQFQEVDKFENEIKECLKKNGFTKDRAETSVRIQQSSCEGGNHLNIHTKPKGSIFPMFYSLVSIFILFSCLF